MDAKKSIIICILTIVALLMGSATQAEETKTMNCKVSCYLAHIEVLPVGDVEGHGVSISSRKGLAFFESGEVATFTNWATQDATKGKGPHQGYAMFTFEDGSTFVGKFEGTNEPIPKELTMIKGTGVFIKGTGRFEGIKGSYTYSGKTFTPYSKETKGDLYFDFIGTYTLPTK